MTPTPDQIRSEPAGPRMDAWVAEHVMGWQWFQWKQPSGKMLRGIFPPKIEDRINFYIHAEPANMDTPQFVDVMRFVPRFSTDIAAAWEVMERMKPRSPYLCWNDPSWLCVVDASDDPNDIESTPVVGVRGYVIDRRRIHVIVAETVPLTICRAALLAKVSLPAPPENAT